MRMALETKFGVSCRHWLMLLVIITTPIVAYWNSLDGEFHFDDYHAIVDNSGIKSFDKAFGMRTRFVTDVSLAIDYSLGKLDVRYYHAQQVFWHVVNCVLIYFIVLLTLRRVGIDKSYLALLTSLFFALHPINTEPLNYIIAGRSMILCTMFYLLGLLFFILAFEQGEKKWLYFSGCGICYILSVFSKEVGITLPGVLFFYYVYFICDNRKSFLKAIALFAMAMVLVIIYALWYGLPGMVKERLLTEGHSQLKILLKEHLLQLKVSLIYLKLYLLPLPSFLNIDHAINNVPYHLDIETIFAAVIIIGLIFLTIATYKHNRLISFSLAYLFITHSPTTFVRRGEPMAEYKNYLPFFGFALLAILCFSELSLLIKLQKKHIVIAVLVVVVLFGYAVVERNNVWKHDLSLWNDAVAKAPNNSRAYSIRAVSKKRLGDYDGAIKDCDIAIGLNPSYADAYNNRAAAKGASGNYREAIADCDEAIKLDPRCAAAYSNRGSAKLNLKDYEGTIESYDRSLEIAPYDAEAYNYRGYAKYALGDYREAISDYDKALQLNLDYAEAYNNRGTAKSDLGDKKGAIEDYDRSLEIAPNDATTYYNRGVAKSSIGDHRGAISDYDKAIELNPNYVKAYLNRGVAKGTLGNYKEAISDYDKALGLNPNLIEVYSNRGAAKYALGDYREAISDYDKAIELNSGYAGAYNNRGLAKNAIGDYKGAIGDYNKALELNPNHSGSYVNRGLAKDALGDHKGAVGDWEKAIQLDPSFKEKLQSYINQARK